MTDDSIAARFNEHFDARPNVFWAPGRVNLLGDHVDYCGGAVLPMPIQFGTSVAVRLRTDGRLRASANEPAQIDGSLPIWWTSRLALGTFLRGAIGVLAVGGSASTART
jgi:galactokinase